MSQKKLTVLIAATDAVGHFNACIGIGEGLRDGGHTVVFAVPDSWKNKLAPLGFVEEWYYPNSIEAPADVTAMELFTGMTAKMGPVFQLKDEEVIRTHSLTTFKAMIEQTKKYDPILKEIVARVKPDVILADLFIHQPAVMDAGIPWVLGISAGPLGISQKNVPPATSGFPITGKEQDKEVWRQRGELCQSIFADAFKDLKTWVVANGGPEFKHSGMFMMKYSPYANIYMYPEELDYTEFRPNPPKFHRFDAFMRDSKESFEIPEKLKDGHGKLVYFSMGTIGCGDITMMKRLISVFRNCSHRFIVSMGPLADQLELPENMWGRSSLPQLAIIPLVDLVICHGGNNTLTESFYFGKPMIAFPLFGDQPDNAQRLMEKGFGIRLHPYHSSEAEILEAIDKIVYDEELSAKMGIISRRIQGSDNRKRIIQLIEKVASGIVEDESENI